MHATDRGLRAWIPLALAVALALFMAPAVAWAEISAPATDTVPVVVATATVTFDSAGGSAIDPQVVDVGSLVATPAPDPTRTGYTFLGWYSDALGLNAWDFSAQTVTADTTIYAAWAINSYNVSFVSNGGTAVAGQTVTYGGLVAEPTPPTLTGYTFAGWYSDAALTQAWDFSASTVTGHVTLRAKWTLNSYPVAFASNGGSSVGTQTVEYGGLVTRPANPVRTGYTFAGWYADGALTQPWDFATDTISGATTLYARWTINSYSVTFASNGGSAVSTQTVQFGSLATRPADPTRTGHTFAGWYADAGLAQTWDFATDTVSGPTTLYAKWTVNSYAVAFASNGGSAVSSQTVVYGGLVTRPANPTRTGYAFAGWYADGALTQAWDFAADTIGGATTLYARWTINSYSVTFASNGGSAVNSQAVNYGGLVTKPANPTRTGYTFAGWYADAGLAAPWDFAAGTISGATTLYAKWTINSYAVSFDSHGGTAVSSQTIVFGSLVTKPADPTKTGSTFGGWFADAAYTTPWSFSASTVSGPTTLHAKWVVNGYSVSFDSNGGSAVDAQAVEYGALVARPTNPARTGYTFVGWFADAALATPWNFSAMTISGNTTLYAKWAITSYKVTFDSNGGSAVASQTVVFDGLVTRPTNPVRSGYLFAGWFADAALATPWDFAAEKIGAADMSLYAKWTKTFTITGYAGTGGTMSVRGARVVATGTNLTVYITPATGYGVSNVKVDGVSKGALRSYTFSNITANHTISVTFKRTTSTSFSASATSIKRGGYVTLYGRVRSGTSSFSNTYLRFEVKLPGSKTYILLKTVKVSSSGRAKYRYAVLNKGTRYHRVRFLGNATYLPAPLRSGVALKVY